MITRSTSEHLLHLRRHLSEVENQLGAPEVAADSRRMAELGREHSDLRETISIAEQLLRAESNLSQTRELIESEADDEMRALAEEELADAEQRVATLMEEFQLRLLPPDPLDHRNIMLEIRAGTGGDEAALFAGDLLRMYSRYAEEKGWKVELLSSSHSDLGGFREVIVQVSGPRVYSFLKFESGTHRVQRVPATETQGRIHTSAATVAVLPEAEETDIHIADSDLRIDTMCSSGPGGQSVNTTKSAVRIVHLPTGMIISCQDERSQLQNKIKAMMVLRSRLLERKMQEEDAARSALRKGQVGSGDRSGRIRTYNFPQNRLTDHRINLTIYSLDRVMEGDLGLVLEPLRSDELRRRLEELAH